jgi:hypothetical protein
MDLTGDNVPDLAILANPSDLGPISDLSPELQASIPKYYLSEEKDYYLSGGTSGFIMFTSDINSPRRWENPKYYYRPIPLTQQVLNENLQQVFGW